MSPRAHARTHTHTHTHAANTHKEKKEREREREREVQSCAIPRRHWLRTLLCTTSLVKRAGAADSPNELPDALASSAKASLIVRVIGVAADGGWDAWRTSVHAAMNSDQSILFGCPALLACFQMLASVSLGSMLF